MKYLTEITRRWWVGWLLLGVVIRIFLMPITLHPDLWGHSIVAYLFAYKGILDPYSYIQNLPLNDPLVINYGATAVRDIFIYPPLTYFTLGLFRLFVRPLADSGFIPWLIENMGRENEFPGLMWQIFIFKLPYLFVDIILACVFSSLFDETRKKKLAFIFWIFNPINLYSTFMVGQIDILPVFFVILSLYFVRRKKPVWAMLSLGIGGAYKMFPLLLLFPAVFVLKKKLADRMLLTIYGFLPFIVTIAPYLNSAAFREMVLFSPKSQKMLFMGWNLSGAEVIYPFILILMFIYFYAYYQGKKARLESYYLAILLLIFSVTHYHPQWFLWVSPLLIWKFIEDDFSQALLYLTLFVSWVFITFMFESSLSYGLFNPIWPELRNTESLATILVKYTDINQIKSIVRSVFAAASLYLAVSEFRKI